jgi:pimeloyl-ACP methyl ester carboxylesterase
MTAELALVSRADSQMSRLTFERIGGEPERQYYLFIPANLRPNAEPLVLIHGISRNAAELTARFSPVAARWGVPLIAPVFARDAYGQYQQVVDRKRGVRSDLALLHILDDTAQRFGLKTNRIALFGFSGGAQFAHRFAILHARRVRCCVPVSAGWYTMPDTALPWPLGLDGLPGGTLDPAALSVPFHLIVGQRDTRCDDTALRHDALLDRLQGTDRRARARAWHRALRDAGWNGESSLTTLPRTRHNFTCAHRRGLTETVFRLLGYEGTDQ